MTQPGAGPPLRRTLRFTDLVLLTVGTTIGSGIYLVPSIVLRQTGEQVGPAMLVWVLAGVLSVLGALTYAELGAMKPEAGGLYVFIRDAFGPLPAFLYGWTSFFVIASGSLAALAVAFASYLSNFLAIDGLTARAVSVALLAVCAAINVRGTRESAAVQNWTSGAKIAGLVLMGLALSLFGTPPTTAVTFWPAEIRASLLTGFGTAMIGVLWAYEGWQYMTYAAGETLDPQRTFPRAITVATAALVVLYLLASYGYVAALGPEAAARSDHVAADATRALLGPVAGTLIGTLILVSIFSAANGIMLTAPRMYFAMARDGLFFDRFAEVDAKRGTPATAVLALAAWSVVLAVSGTFEQLLTYIVFTAWIFYGLGALAVFVLRRSEPGAVRPFRVPGYPVTPALFVASSLLLVLNTVIAQPARAALGMLAVLLGTPAFFFWRTRSRARR
ncbi:MAG: amino acid permease [Gemmatimonadetes bacterium]|jgi:APA family basic amino acid/polyamine antiporter|nr:amino acid permease [Gemmatimonadota bacterium]